MKKTKKRRSIKRELIIAVGATIILVCIGYTLVSGVMLTNALRTNLEQSLSEIAKGAANTVVNQIEANFGYLDALSSCPEFHDIVRYRNVILSKMGEMVKEKGYHDMIVSDQSGRGFSLLKSDIDIGSYEFFKSASGGKNYISDPMFLSDDNNMVIVYTVPIYNYSDVFVGTISALVKADDFSDQIGSISYAGSGYSFIINGEGTVIAHVNHDLVTNRDNIIKASETDSSLKALAELQKRMVVRETGSGTYVYLGERKSMGYAPIDNTDWSLGVTTSNNDLYKDLVKLNIVMATITVLSIIAAIIIANIIAEMFKKPIASILHIAQRMAEGDFSMTVSDKFVKRKNEFGELAAATKVLLENTNRLLADIQIASERVAEGARQISASSVELSHGTTEQSSSIEELTATIDEISSQTHINAENAEHANMLAINAQKSAANGNSKMTEMLAAMEEINQSSSNISKIIKVIEEIAFQTNLLALNASVEAARAGQHGKGFAVVAEEVRNLAARSAKAAKETAELIENSMYKVEDGSKIASETADELRVILDEVTKVAEIVSSISKASAEQSIALTQVNDNIAHVSSAVQESTATAEENASASEELSRQAVFLDELVGKFKINEDVIKSELSEVEGRDKKAALPQSENSNERIRISLNDNEFGKY